MAKYTPTLNDSGFFTGADKHYCKVHHIFYGNPFRALSEEWGMKIYVIPDRHKFKQGSIHMDADVDLEVKQYGQLEFEKLHGHDKFVEVFRKNYLDPIDWVIKEDDTPKPKKVRLDTVY